MAISAFGPADWGDRETSLWEDIASDFPGMELNRELAEYFSAGWLHPAANKFTKRQRRDIREKFFTAATRHGVFMTSDDFDWERWRNYMGYHRR